MSKQTGRKISRRKFVKLTGGAAAAAGFTSAFLFPQRALAQQKTLKILQWSHFVPGYDKWFDNTFTKEWGAKNNTNVVVDHIAIGEINARAAAEVSAKKGHDLFMFLSPPAAYEKQVIDHGEVYAAVEKKHGKKIDLAHKSTYNPKTKKYFAFSDAYTPDPGNWHKDWWTEAGYPNGPTPTTNCWTARGRSDRRTVILAAWVLLRNWTPAWPCAPFCGPSAAPSRMSTAT